MNNESEKKFTVACNYEQSQTDHVLVTLCDEILLKLEQEFKVQKVIRGQGFLANNCLHSLHIFADSIARILHIDTQHPVTT